MSGKLIILGVLFLILAPLIFFLTGGDLSITGKGKKAGLQITTNVSAKVFLDEITQGNTPFKKEDLKPQEYKIRLEPEGDLLPWEGRAKLVAGLMTVVDRELAGQEQSASGSVLTLEKISDKEKASFTVITDPSSSVVVLDGEPRGFSPITLNNLEAGSHSLLISATGFKERKQGLELIKGYRLTANIQLAKIEEKEPEEEATESAKKDQSSSAPADAKAMAGKKASESKEATVSGSLGSELERPYVKIKETGTGWLRVRSEPVYKVDNSNEVAKVDVGGNYKLLDETTNGWYQIEYKKGKAGWISGRYADKFE